MKSKKRRFSSLYIFPVIFIVICISYIFRFLFFNIETEIVKYDSWENLASAEALVVRSEWVTSLPAGVQIEYKANEGEKVYFGKKILEIVKSGSSDAYMTVKIKQIDERINEIKQSDISNNFFSQDKEKIENKISEGVQELKSITKSGGLENLQTVKENLVANLYKKSLIYGSGSFFGKNLDSLVKEKATLENIHKNNIDDIFAQTTGIISYQMDGYEQILNPLHVKSFKLDNIKEIMNTIKSKKEKGKEAEENINGVKIVDNYEWYVCSILDEAQCTDLKPRKKVKLRFEGENIDLVNAEVFDVLPPENKQRLAIFKVNENVRDFHKLRLVKLTVVKDSYEGFVIPVKCIVSRGDEKGVYAVKYGLVKYIPVKVLTMDEKSAIVRNLEGEEAQLKGSTSTLKLFDEVILTVNRVKENQVLSDKI